MSATRCWWDRYPTEIFNTCQLSPIPPPRKTPVRSSPRLESFKAAIDAMLWADAAAPRKQRHTARRILHRLIEDYDTAGCRIPQRVT
jgi:hypothetical protein